MRCLNYMHHYTISESIYIVKHFLLWNVDCSNLETWLRVGAHWVDPQMMLARGKVLHCKRTGTYILF